MYLASEEAQVVNQGSACLSCSPERGGSQALGPAGMSGAAAQPGRAEVERSGAQALGAVTGGSGCRTESK